MAGTIIVDRIESDASYASSINVAAQVTFSNTAIFNAGSVSAPSISFSGNTTTGMYMPLANTLAFSTAGSEDMRLDPGGNVSIGATSTVGKLNVTGNDNAHLYLKQNNTDNGWLMATSSADGVFRLQRRGEGASPTNAEKFSVQPDGQMFHNATYLLGSSYNAYHGKASTSSNVVSGFNDTGLVVASVYIPTNVRKVFAWIHFTLRSNGLIMNHTGVRFRVVRASDGDTTYVGNGSWGFGISQTINNTGHATVTNFVNLYDYDGSGNQAGLTAGQTYTFTLQATDAFASGSNLRFAGEAGGTHENYTPAHATIWVL
jgi:hypothetical protein